MLDNYTTKVVRFPLFNRAGDVVAVTIIDESDIPLVINNTWYLSSDGRAFRRERRGGRSAKSVNIYMSQIILGIKPGSGYDIQVDHKDRDRLNNRRGNLRKVDAGGNSQNVSPHKDGSSRFRGVTWKASINKWQVDVWIDGKHQYIGVFESEEQAGRIASECRKALMPYTIED